MNIDPVAVEKDLYAVIDVLVAALFALDREYAAGQRGPSGEVGATVRGAELIGLATRMLKGMACEPSRDFVSAADSIGTVSHALAGFEVPQARFSKPFRAIEPALITTSE